VALALIYGSLAKGTDTAASDIDLLVVADELPLEDLYSALAPVEAVLDRRISPILFTSAEHEARIATNDGFLPGVLADQHLVLLDRSDEATGDR
jgi:predicted nucleotidyltransferase